MNAPSAVEVVSDYIGALAGLPRRYPGLRLSADRELTLAAMNRARVVREHEASWHPASRALPRPEPDDGEPRCGWCQADWRTADLEPVDDPEPDEWILPSAYTCSDAGMDACLARNEAGQQPPPPAYPLAQLSAAASAAEHDAAAVIVELTAWQRDMDPAGLLALSAGQPGKPAWWQAPLASFTDPLERAAAAQMQNPGAWFGPDGVALEYQRQQQPGYPRRPADPWAQPGAVPRPGDTISGLAHVTYGPQQQPCPQQAAPVPDSPPAAALPAPAAPVTWPRRGAQRAKGRRAGR
jgi:hypothetical protein